MPGKARVKIREIKGKPRMVVQAEAKLEAKERKFDEGFIKALYVDYMSDPINRVNPQALKKFCNVYNVPQALVILWGKNEGIQKEIRTTVRERFGYGERIKELYDLLWQQCRTGRISAIKLALELTGEYVPKMQHMDRPKSLEDLLGEMDKQMKAEEDGKDKSPRLN